MIFCCLGNARDPGRLVLQVGGGYPLAPGSELRGLAHYRRWLAFRESHVFLNQPITSG